MNNPSKVLPVEFYFQLESRPMNRLKPVKETRKKWRICVTYYFKNNCFLRRRRHRRRRHQQHRHFCQRHRYYCYLKNKKNAVVQFIQSSVALAFIICNEILTNDLID